MFGRKVRGFTILRSWSTSPLGDTLLAAVAFLNVVCIVNTLIKIVEKIWKKIEQVDVSSVHSKSENCYLHLRSTSFLTDCHET